jgi:hypothetical protein
MRPSTIACSRGHRAVTNHGWIRKRWRFFESSQGFYCQSESRRDRVDHRDTLENTLGRGIDLLRHSIASRSAERGGRWTPSVLTPAIDSRNCRSLVADTRGHASSKFKLLVPGFFQGLARRHRYDGSPEAYSRSLTSDYCRRSKSKANLVVPKGSSRRKHRPAAGGVC